MSFRTFLFGDKNYGFITNKQLPKNIKEEKCIVNNNIKLVKTSDYNHCAKNHCAATLLTNLCIIYADRGYKNLLSDNTFLNIHNLVGDGPVMVLSKRAKKYVKSCGYSLITTKLNSLDEIKEKIDEDIPCALLLEDGLFEWHWILAIGYKDNYLQIVDNWHSDLNRYYMINEGSKLISAKSYKVL